MKHSDDYRMIKWECGHETSKSYRYLQECPVCLLLKGKYVETLNGIEEEREKENKRNLRESLEFSKTFNRQGCKYCGGI